MMRLYNENGLFIAGYSKTGPSHIKRGQGNQDRYLYGFSGINTFYIALSDGVSSAPFAEEGASAAVSAVKTVSEEIATGCVDITDRKGIQNRIVQIWKSRFVSDWNNYAATINFIIVHENRMLIGRIGDGLIVAEVDEAYMISSNEEEFYSTETAALGTAVSRKDFDIQLAPIHNHFSAYMASDGIGKEIAETSLEDVNRYLLDLARGSEKTFEKEIVSWVAGLDKKNLDDKTIIYVRWEEM